MTIALLVAALAAFVLAFANGANDNGKGVATLIGSGTMRLRPAIVYATATTLLGSITALLLAGALLKTFSGKGIVPEAVHAAPAFAVSVGLGAAGTVLIATRVGIPISTTHSIVGAIVGVGVASEVIWSAVWLKFAYPLLAAPALAAALTVPAYLLLRWLRVRSGVTCRSCLCVEPLPKREAALATVPTRAALREGSTPVAASAATPVRLRAGHLPECRQGLEGRVIGVDAQRALDWSHLLTAGAVSFARGLNDTPKIAAVLLAASGVAALGGVAITPGVALVAVGLGIALGGLLAARRVAVTMSERITEMNDGQGFTANLVTAVLVIFASRLGVPVSTTHVSCGSLFGIGIASRAARWRMIGSILLAWVTTLPLAAVIGWLAFTGLS
jgi:PiT family inorganic phosphate transporter